MNEQEILNILLQKPTSQLIELSQKEKNYLYNLAARKCQVGDYKGAHPLFRLLFATDAKNSLYAKSLAACQQDEKEYFAACSLYYYAYILDRKNNSDCLFYMANCHISLKDYTGAKKCLDELANQVGLSQAIVKRSKLLAKMVERNLASDSKADSEQTK